jgi:hypothetical protein
VIKFNKDKERLKIKGIPNISVGDYERKDSLNQKEDGDDAVVNAVLEADREKQQI